MCSSSRTWEDNATQKVGQDAMYNVCVCDCICVYAQGYMFFPTADGNSLLTYLFTYLLTYLLHGAESFLRS
jgi:hypothetical protein